MSFRIGRKFAQHTYPEPRGAGATPQPFARNFASGPFEDQDIGENVATPLFWENISSGAPSGIEIPITPLSTGVVRVLAAVTLKNLDTNADVIAQLVIDGVQIDPPDPVVTVLSGTNVILTFLAEFEGLAIGVTVPVSLVLSADGSGVDAVASGSTIEIHEVVQATG
jgi:hypothetical protein